MKAAVSPSWKGYQLSAKIKDLNVDPESVYFKGDEFKGLLFAKSQNENEDVGMQDHGRN